MIQSIKHISIPDPCSQNWDDMIPTTGGRHCEHCCKTVTDFTAMTNQEIVDAIANHTNMCGHIHTWQMESINRGLGTPKPSVFNWKGFSLAASLFFAIPATNTYAQHKTAKHRAIPRPKSSKLVVFKTVTGTIVDSVNRLPLPGVVVCAKGNPINTVTGLDGRYSLDVPENTDQLLISYAGYHAQYIPIVDGNNTNVILTESSSANIVGYQSRRVTTVLGGAVSIVTIRRPSFFRRMYNHLIIQPVKKIFG